MKATVIQLNTKNNKAENLHQVEQLITKACEQTQPNLIALPEMFAFMGGSIEEKKAAAEVINRDPAPGSALKLLKTLAKKFHVIIHGGSFCELDNGRYYNTTCIINTDGELLTTYRKINLFSFMGANQTFYDEGTLFTPGNEVVSYQHTLCTIGCAICFDLRFRVHFEKLISKNVDMIIIPSAFTYETGKAHWETLVRARAIETQSFVIAPAQVGKYFEGDKEKICWGHSMVVDPWGKVLLQMKEEIGFANTILDLDYIKEVRTKLPLRATTTL